MKKAEHICNEVDEDIWFEYCGSVGGNDDAPLQSGCIVYSSNIKEELQEQITMGDTEVLRDLEAWENAEKWSRNPKLYTPDFIYRKRTLSGETFFMIGGIKSSKLTTADKTQVWNQALVGLRHRKQTVALYIEPTEAGIVTIKMEGGSIYTYKREYQIGERDPKKIKQGDTVAKPDEFCHFFHDLVLTMCHHCFST